MNSIWNVCNNISSRISTPLFHNFFKYVLPAADRYEHQIENDSQRINQVEIHICQQAFNFATPPYPFVTRDSRTTLDCIQNIIQRQPFLHFASIRISYLAKRFHLSASSFVIEIGELSRIWRCLVFLRYGGHIFTRSVKRIYKWSAINDNDWNLWNIYMKICWLCAVKNIAMLYVHRIYFIVSFQENIFITIVFYISLTHSYIHSAYFKK